MRRAAALVGVALAVAGCGAGGPPAKRSHAPAPRAGAGTSPPKQRRGGGIPPDLLAAVRPIGRGPRFQPPAGRGVLGACRKPLGRRLQAHIEIFGADRVVLLPGGLGARAPRRIRDGRLVHASCFGALVTLDPTGIVYLRPGSEPTLGDLFTLWGQPLSYRRIASFTGGRVRVYVDGRTRRGSPGNVRLTPDAEIVLEVGPRVPPHAHFSFPPAPAAGLR